MAANSAWNGRQIGNYQIVAELASGGFGSVFQGRHAIFTERPIVAVKLLHTHLNSQREHAQFIQEARLLERLRHPQILSIIDAGIHEGFPYLVTAFAPHGSLRALLRRQSGRPLPLETALPILEQVSTALQFAHDQQVVHRDLKPENILFAEEGTALLADFGLAIILESGSVQSATRSGTPAYMAPEQFRGSAGRFSDQYALGCVAYELLTGRKPFPQREPLVLMVKHATEAPEPPAQLNPLLSPALEQAILRAMAKERSARFPDVASFSAALRDACPEIPRSLSTLPSSPVSSSSLSPTSSPSASAIWGTTPFTAPPPIFEEPTPGTEPGSGALLQPASHLTPVPRRLSSSRPLFQPENADAEDDEDVLITPGSDPELDADLAEDSSEEANSGEYLVNFPQPIPLATRSQPPITPPVARATRPSGPGSSSNIGVRRYPSRTLPSRPAPTRPGPASTPRARRKLLLFGAPILLLLVLIAGWLTLTASATATLTLTPLSSLQTNTYTLTGVPGTPDPTQRQVQSRVITSPPQSQQQTVPASGHTQTAATSAHGLLTFFNGAARAQTIQQGATFDLANGIIIVTDEVANLPAARIGISFGSATIQAHASSGIAGNIKANTLHNQVCCVGDGSITVNNPAPFTGGQDATNFTFVQQSDINNTARTLEGSLTQKARQAFNTQVPASDRLVAPSSCPPQVTSNQNAGDHANRVTVTVTVACSGTTYTQEAAQTLVTKLLSQSASQTLGPAYALQGNVQVTATSATGDAAQGTLAITFSARGAWRYRLDAGSVAALKQLVSGLDATQARTTLARQPGLADATIRLGPFSQKLPANPDQIQVIIL